MEDPIAEMKALVEQWKHATDPESLWILRLLREAIEKREKEKEELAQGGGGESDK